MLIASLIALVAFTGWTLTRSARNDRLAEARNPPSGRIIDVGGVPVHVWVKGEGPDLVLIHGASGNLRDFTFDLAERLASRYRVIAFDRPGLGYTGRSDPAFAAALTAKAETPRAQARLLATAARQLGADKPLVLGHSYGGAVAMAWALEEPLSGVLDLAGATLPWSTGLGLYYDINGSALGGALAAPVVSAFARQSQIDATMESIFAPHPVPPGYAKHVAARLTVRKDTVRANARQVATLLAAVTEMAPHYREITAPVSIVHGALDTIVPASVHAGPLLEFLPDGELLLLPGVGHMPHHEATDDVIAAIDRLAERAGLKGAPIVEAAQ